MKVKRVMAIILIVLFSTLLSGCWNYNDIEKYSLVAGASIDKINNKYIVNVEVMDFQMSGREANQTSNIIEAKGNTIFDAIRNIINITGKKLYWGHAKVLIISKDVAEEGIIKILDLSFRDAEIREEMHIVVSNKDTAKSILKNKTVTSNLICYDIDKMIENQTELGEAPTERVYEIIEDIEEEGIAPAIPICDVKTNAGKSIVELIGTAVFKKDKLVGYLNPKESKYFLFVVNKIDKGLLVENILDRGQATNVTLEIFKNNTKIKPVYDDGKISINVNIKVDAAIAEVNGSKDVIYSKGRTKLELEAEESLKTSVINTINKVQRDYDADIFKFGKYVKADLPSVWDDVGYRWNNEFKNTKVNVNVEIKFRNSALNSSTIERGM